MARPALTIITATFNRAALLEEAIASVHVQWRDDVEHLIVDGASTDGTRAMLAKWPHLRVISEPDRGIYDAFNKGLALAQGDAVHFLNSDDLLTAGTLDAVIHALADESVDVVSGGTDFFERDESGERVVRQVEGAAELELSVRQILRGASVVNARFFRRRLVEKIGRFDLAYRIAADRDFLVRTALLQPQAAVVPQLVYRYRSHADSLTVHDTARNVALIRTEHLRLAETHLARTLAVRDRAELVSLHRRESAALAVDALMQGDLPAARKWAQRGCAVSAAWPVAALCRAGGWLLGLGRRSALAAEEAAPR